MTTNPPPPPALVWPAPKEEIPSPDFTLEAAGQPVFVYQTRVRAKIIEKPGLWSHDPDPAGERASFAIFDIREPARVTVTPARPFRTAEIRPAKAGITPAVSNGTVTFTVAAPQPLTLLLDGSDQQALHLFIGAPETDAPKPDDPNVLYFGPGTHLVNQLKVKKGQTVYLAGGAVVKSALKPDEKGTYSDQWKITFHGGVALDFSGADHARLCGRGILDGSLIPHPGYNMIRLGDSSNVRLGGVTLRDAPNWNVAIHKSRDVVVDGLRIISGRLNSDGINSCGSRRVTVRNCFVRNQDDGIVVKTLEAGHPAEDITVENCVVWADWGFALGVTYETRSPISRIRFRDCAVIYARHWCLGIRVCDSALVSDVVFDGIEMGDCQPPFPGGAHNALTAKPNLIWFGIVKDCWGKDAEPGRIRDIRIENVKIMGQTLPPSTILGFDEAHPTEGVTIRNVGLASRPPALDAAALGLRTNAFVRSVRFE